MARSSCRGRPAPSTGVARSTHDDGAVRAPLCPLRRRAGQVAEADALRSARRRARSVASSTSSVSRVGELVDVLEHVADHLAAAPRAGEPLEAGPSSSRLLREAGQRRAHLVAGIGHQPALLLLGAADTPRPSSRSCAARLPTSPVAADVDRASTGPAWSRCRCAVSRRRMIGRTIRRAIDPPERSGGHCRSGDERCQAEPQRAEQRRRSRRGCGRSGGCRRRARRVVSIRYCSPSIGDRAQRRSSPLRERPPCQRRRREGRAALDARRDRAVGDTSCAADAGWNEPAVGQSPSSASPPSRPARPSPSRRSPGARRSPRPGSSATRRCSSAAATRCSGRTPTAARRRRPKATPARISAIRQRRVMARARRSRRRAPCAPAATRRSASILARR